MSWRARLSRRWPRLSAPPLRVTTATTLLLLLLPAVALWRLPRPRAEGLGRLMTQAALLQSFPAAPSRPVPRLWQERLGPATARRLWQQQRRLWWQFWGREGVGAAYLVLPLPRPMLTGALPKPAHSVVVDDLLVVAPDPLSHRLLSDQLRQQPRQRRGLEQRCLARLEQEQAAFWTPVALGAMTGPMAPLLQGFQEGCVSLALEGDSLAARGEAADTSGLLSPPPPPVPAATLARLSEPALTPSPDSLLLLQGRTLDVVLEGLLSRQLILDPLASRYGVGVKELSRLRRTPFRLELRRVSNGRFQAGLSLHLAPGVDRRAWAEFLGSLRTRLEQEGLRDVQDEGSATLPSSSWRGEDGEVVGGWHWLSRTGGAPELLLFLGPEPAAAEAGKVPPVAPPAAALLLTMVLQPRALAELGLMPPALPSPLLQAQQLTVVAQGSSEASSPISGLWGRLQLQPVDPPKPGDRPGDRSGGRPEPPPKP